LELKTGNFVSQVWEYSESLDPYGFKYFISKDADGSQILVHESDQFNDADILKGISNYRRGREIEAAKNYKKAIFEAKVGDSVLWVSPKAEKDEDCVYVDTQINIAVKISENEVEVKQFQSKHLNTTKTALVLNALSGYQTVHPESLVDDVIVAIGVRKGKIDDEEVKDAIIEISGVLHKELIDFKAVEKDILRLSEVNSRKYMQAIDSGLSGEVLDKYQEMLLRNILDSAYKKSYERMYPQLTMKGEGFIPPLPDVIRMNCSVYGGGAEQPYGSPFMPPMFRLFYDFQQSYQSTESSGSKYCSKCEIKVCCTAACHKCGGELTTRYIYD
jgi:hypothetical protein